MQTFFIHTKQTWSFGPGQRTEALHRKRTVRIKACHFERSRDKWDPPDRVGCPSEAEDKSHGTHSISVLGSTIGAEGSLRFGRDDKK